VLASAFEGDFVQLRVIRRLERDSWGHSTISTAWLTEGRAESKDEAQPIALRYMTSLSEEPLMDLIRRALQSYIIAQFLPAPREVILKRFRWVGITLISAALLWLIAFAVVRLWARYDHNEYQSTWYQQPASQASGLVVIVHGWTNGPRDMKQVAEVVRSESKFKQYVIYLWSYESGRFSNKNPVGLAHDLAIKIGGLHQRTNGEIILIGHSLGGLLIRRAFLDALDDKREWPTAVSRIVLLAAPNRGTKATSRSPWLWVVDGLARSFGVGELIRSTYRGAPFIVDLRIDWIRRFQHLKNPLVLQASAPRYKYFSALQFVNPLARRHKIYEFADLYAEMLATPPVDAPHILWGIHSALT